MASGGMATVWLAVHQLTGRAVALKRMLPGLASDPEARSAFLDEGSLGMRLQHPNIVETLAKGAFDAARGKEAYLVLELLHGRSLNELIRRAAELRRPLPIAVALTIIRDAARGLHHAHQLVDDSGAALGLIHRDVSPHNVFVCRDGTSKILDFGIAKSRAQTHRTDPGTIRGKVSYLAPEQLLGGEIDPQLDVFALGVVLHELLTGERLFNGASEGETLSRVLGLAVQSPEAGRADVSPAVGALALRALQRDRERRLPSAAALADTIEAIAAVEALELGPRPVGAFLDELFPDDAQRFAHDLELAQAAQCDVAPAPEPDMRSPLHHAAIVQTPWTPPRHRGSGMGGLVLRVAIAVCVMSLSAFAAMNVVRALRPGPQPAVELLPPRTNSPVIATSRPQELTIPTLAPPAPQPAKVRRGFQPKNCGVYFSLTGGTSVVPCDPKSGSAKKPSRHH